MDIAFTVGVGKIVTLKLAALPEHPFKVGATEILPVIFALVLFKGAVHGAICPFPLAAISILVFVFVQSKAAPEGTLTKLGIVMVVPGHACIDETAFTVGVGLTVTLKLNACPWHVLSVGVTEIIPVILAFVVLVGAVHGEILPVPAAKSPMIGLEFAHV